MKKLSKRERVVVLLDHWPEFFEPTSVSSFESQVSTLGEWAGPSMSTLARHPSVVELGRCLEVCRRMASGHYGHLRAFYGAEWRTVDAMVKRRGPNGKLVVGVERVRERVLPRELQQVPGCLERGCCEASRLPRTVCRSVDFLVGVSRGPLEIPLVLDRKLRPLADSDGWTEAA